MWILAATTSMRRSELGGAERALLDLDNTTLELADTRIVVDGKAEDSDGKSEERTAHHVPGPAHCHLRTIAEFLAEWLDTVRDSIKPSTYANYIDYRDAYVLPTIGKRRLQDIDVPTLNALYRHLLSAGRCKRDTNTTMYEYWSTRRKAGIEPKLNEIATHCAVSIHAARAAVLRYRRGRIPIAKPPGLATKNRQERPPNAPQGLG